MKRSEALLLITEVVSEVTYKPLAEKRAEKILKALEAAGMNPPWSELGCHCANHNDKCNEWEPE